eukprot:3594730-Amphidinium_carterae.1
MFCCTLCKVSGESATHSLFYHLSRSDFGPNPLAREETCSDVAQLANGSCSLHHSCEGPIYRVRLSGQRAIRGLPSVIE